MAMGFPKIWALGSPQAARIFNGAVEITEKIDGSQFNFGTPHDGELILRSKGAVQSPATPDKLFRPVIDWVLSIQGKLPSGLMFHGETLCGVRHNTLQYGRVPKGNFMLYGISQGDKFTSEFSELQKWADVFGCETVPLLGTYDIKEVTEDLIKQFMDRDSALGGCKPEGFVIKNYAESYLLGGQFISVLAAKFVSEAFKEQHKMEWKTGKDHLEEMKQSFRTDARWMKAIQHLRDDGKLQYAPQDIGPLMKELAEDFVTEEAETVKNLLWNYYKKDFVRAAVGGFPEWYKTQLALGTFKN
jgi:hypothetical protein